MYHFNFNLKSVIMPIIWITSVVKCILIYFWYYILDSVTHDVNGDNSYAQSKLKVFVLYECIGREQ